MSIGVVITFAGLGLADSAPAFGAVEPSKPQPKVTICHATSSVSDPYDQITVSANSIVEPDGTPTGHGTHTGPIYPTADWGDIIPAFEYNNDNGGTSTFAGLNWHGHGQAIFDGGCLVVLVPIQPPEPEESTTTSTPPTTTPPTTVPPTTTPPSTVPPTTSSPTTTTTLPSATSSPTSPPTTSAPPTSSAPTTSTPALTAPTTPVIPTVPGASTTTAGTSTSVPGATTVPGSPTTSIPAEVPSTPPTTALPSQRPPPLVDPPGDAEIMPPTEAEVIDPGDQVVKLGPLDPPQREALENDLDLQTTPVPSGAPQAGLGGESTSKGLSSGWLTAGGIFLLLGGTASFAMWRRRRSA